MQVVISQEVIPSAVNTIEDIFSAAANVSAVEGLDLMNQTIKMNIAAGDLAACLTEKTPCNCKDCSEELHDEVAALILRAVIFGTAFGMTPDDLRKGFEREAAQAMR